MNQQEKRNKVIVLLAKAYEEKDTALTNRVEAIVIPHGEPLPQKLQEVLDSWGNTPIQEPEFYELINKDGTTLDEVKTMALKNLNADDFSALDVAALANRVRHKIIGKIDDEGMYKTTPKIDQIKLPTTSQLKHLKELAQTEMSSKDFSNEIYKIADINPKDATEWELMLVEDMFTDFARAVDNNTLGNIVDKTPFARYLKN